MRQDVIYAIRDHITVPPHIAACATAVTYDLLHGPAWVILPFGEAIHLDPDYMEIYNTQSEAMDDAEPLDRVAQAYGQPAETLREFIGNLPGTLYVDTDSGSVSECEPESQWCDIEEDENGEEIEVWYDNDNSSIYECDSRDIVLALFGQTIAREFRF